MSTSPERPGAESPHSILIIKPSSLGDVVHTLPAAAFIKRQWPQARLSWLVNPEWAPLLDGNPHLDEVRIFPRGEFRGVRGWGKILPWARRAAAQKGELVLDFQGLLRSALISKLSRGRRVCGLSDAREGARFFYDSVANVAGIEHAVDRYLQLAAHAGAEVKGPLDWPLPAGSAPAGFDASQPFILLHPFSRGAGKSLTAAQVTELCDRLRPWRVVIAGRAEERLAPAPSVTDLLNRTSLPELCWLIRRAAFVISVDSGPMHIAAALTPRLLSIHTWSDPAKVGPYRSEAWIWNGRALFQKRDLRALERHQPCASLDQVAAFATGAAGGH